MNVILLGPQRSGKTLNREAIAEKFNCAEIFDGLSIRSWRPKDPGASTLLIFTEHPNDPEDRRKKLPGLVVSVKEARELLGDQWVEPRINYHRKELT